MKLQRELYFQYHDFARGLCSTGPFLHSVDPKLHCEEAVEDTKLFGIGLLNIGREPSCVYLALEPGWGVLLLVVGEVIPCSLLSYALPGGRFGLRFSGRIDLSFPHWQFFTKVDSLDICWHNVCWDDVCWNDICLDDICWERLSLELLLFWRWLHQVLVVIELVFRRFISLGLLRLLCVIELVFRRLISLGLLRLLFVMLDWCDLRISVAATSSHRHSHLIIVWVLVAFGKIDEIRMLLA